MGAFGDEASRPVIRDSLVPIVIEQTVSQRIASCDADRVGLKANFLAGMHI